MTGLMRQVFPVISWQSGSRRKIRSGLILVTN